MEFEYRNILKETPTAGEIMELAKVGNLQVSDLVNRGSKTFKDLKLDISGFAPQQVAELLQDNPKAMYRPLLTDGKGLVVGFKPDGIQEMLAL